MQDLLLLKLTQNCVSRFNFEKLNIKQLWFLLNVYNKRYVEYVVEYGDSFGLFENNHHKYYRGLATCTSQEIPASTLNSIEKYTIFSNTSSSFFFGKQVASSDVRLFLELVDLGVFSFIPFEKGLEFAKMFLNSDEDSYNIKLNNSFYRRSVLSGYPVLFNIPNRINLDTRFAFKHYSHNNPKINKYINAIHSVNKDASNLKRLNDSLAILILLDVVMSIFNELILLGLSNPSNELFCDFLNVIDNSQLKNELADKEYFNFLTQCQMNAVAGWFFNCNDLKKKNRLDFIDLLTSGSRNCEKIISFIKTNNLYITLKN